MHETPGVKNSIAPKSQGIGIVLLIVALDFVGMGLTLPIIPRLLGAVMGSTDLGWRFGAFLALYALMQFIFSPILGICSDRFGRRPVLLCSLAGAAVDYVFMAVAPSLSLLFIGRGRSPGSPGPARRSLPPISQMSPRNAIAHGASVSSMRCRAWVSSPGP
jgi:MFS family permease